MPTKPSNAHRGHQIATLHSRLAGDVIRTYGKLAGLDGRADLLTDLLPNPVLRGAIGCHGEWTATALTSANFTRCHCLETARQD